MVRRGAKTLIWLAAVAAWATVAYMGVNHGRQIALGADYNDRSQLRKLLKSEQPEMRWLAAGRLAELKDSDAVPDLIAALRDVEGTQRTCRICIALGEIGDPRGVAALSEALFSDESSLDIQRCAAEALGSIGSEDAVSALLEAISRGVMVEGAIQALARAGDPRALTVLSQLSASASQEYTRKIAAEAASEIRKIVRATTAGTGRGQG